MMNHTASIMGILNVTPDSFSDGGNYQHLSQAIAQAEKMVDAGATLIDIGGESSRPGAISIPLEEEIKRTIPVIKALKKNNLNALLSLDTVKPELMQQAIDEGIDFINDISALQNTQSVEIIKHNTAIKICIMHMQGTPQTMQENPQYQDVVTEIMDFFKQRIKALTTQGIEASRIYLDPGFGFGKTLEHNITLFKNLPKFKELTNSLGCAGLLIGVSRKGFIGQITQVKDSKNRQVGSAAAAALAVQYGADIVRVHDVAQTMEILKINNALYNYSESFAQKI